MGSINPKHYIELEHDLKRRLGEKQLEIIVGQIAEIVEQYNLQYTPHTLEYLFSYAQALIAASVENT